MPAAATLSTPPTLLGKFRESRPAHIAADDALKCRALHYSTVAHHGSRKHLGARHAQLVDLGNPVRAACSVVIRLQLFHSKLVL